MCDHTMCLVGHERYHLIAKTCGGWFVRSSCLIYLTSQYENLHVRSSTFSVRHCTHILYYPLMKYWRVVYWTPLKCLCILQIPMEFGAFSGTGASEAIFCNRVSFCLGMQGPSTNIDCEMASAAAAFYVACSQVNHSRGSNKTYTSTYICIYIYTYWVYIYIYIYLNSLCSYVVYTIHNRRMCVYKYIHI